jgi:4-amino-4-deoxy-L-arabinose transferase-like glycosyltransferase
MMASDVSIRSEWPSLAVIAGVFIAGCAVVHPLRDAPVIDDWVYAWSVEYFLKTGELRVLDISAIYPLAQILWGALFARVAGFSVGILRLSTVVLALLGCGALHLMLRELGFGRAISLLGALTMAFDPVFFALSFSFMTDASFVSVAIMAVFCYVSGVRRRRADRLWIGSLFALAAFLIRPVGVVIPLAVIPALVWARDRPMTACQWGGVVPSAVEIQRRLG